MAPDLSEKLLGIDIDDADERQRRNTDEADDEQEELVQFVVFGLGDHRFAVPVAAVRTLADVSDGLTRVPRAPPAIEGMIDLRGEITAVIDPRVHFPNIGTADRRGRERLLVLDRPSDQQSAAIRVDDVIGVETVPASDVVDETSVEDGELSGDALDHPLVVALIEQEYEPAPDVSEVVAGSPAADAAAATGADGGVGGGVGGATLSASQSGLPGDDDAMGTPFAAESEEATVDDTADADETVGESAEAATRREVVVEATPVVDVENLLLASGQRE